MVESCSATHRARNGPTGSAPTTKTRSGSLHVPCWCRRATKTFWFWRAVKRSWRLCPGRAAANNTPGACLILWPSMAWVRAIFTSWSLFTCTLDYRRNCATPSRTVKHLACYFPMPVTWWVNVIGSAPGARIRVTGHCSSRRSSIDWKTAIA
ncbi:hypothetical protein D3C85_892510 [compost metagenome]